MGNIVDVHLLPMTVCRSAYNHMNRRVWDYQANLYYTYRVFTALVLSIW